jgi:hypothetical protein
VVFCTFSALREITSLASDADTQDIYRRAAAILDAALAIGNQAEPTGTAVLATRMDAAKRASEAAYRGETLAA